MTRRTRDEAKEAAQNGLEARLELLIRNAEFKWDLVKGQEMHMAYQKASRLGPVYCPPDSKDANYQKWRKKYYSLVNVDKRQDISTQINRLQVKYIHFLAKWAW